MNLLAVDTAAEALSVAVQAGDKVYAYHRKLIKPHDETLLPVVERLLGRARLKPEQLDAVIAASGPGRFTGIRVGMAYAAVLAGRIGKPAHAVSRLEALAAGRPGRTKAVIEGWRGEKFVQEFEDGKPKGGPRWIGAVEAASWPAPEEPTAARLLRADLSVKRPFEPLYLKPAGYESKARKAG